MKKLYLFLLFITVICSLLFTSCIEQSWSNFRVIGTRTCLMGTNIIGIAGKPSEEPYIEIIYSAADEENPEKNKTTSIMVSPPYIFQNDNVYITYEVRERYNASGPIYHHYYLQRDFEEGGAEYLRIVNHSQDKTIEFFISDVLRLDLNNKLQQPGIMYDDVPVYFLLFPEKDPSGDMISSRKWSVDEVAALYKAEYSGSDEVKLLYANERLTDLIKTKERWYYESILYGIIDPLKSLQGNEKVWLLATPIMFFDLIWF